MLAPLYKALTSSANPLVVNVSSSYQPDPATAPHEASVVLMDHKLPDGDQEGFESDPSASNGYPAVAHLSADADSHHFLAGNPIHASTLGEVVHETRFSSEEPSIYSAEFCDSTPNSIIKLSCKYAQDDFGTLTAEPQGCLHDGPNPVSQRGSLDGIWRLSDRRVNDVYSPSEQDGTWKQAMSRRQQKSASKNSKGSSGKSVSFGGFGVLTCLHCPVCCYPILYPCLVARMDFFGRNGVWQEWWIVPVCNFNCRFARIPERTSLLYSPGMVVSLSGFQSWRDGLQCWAAELAYYA
ncbi:hypothetical protein Nepgr_003910 [Nepenthes gracilis]|uniref:Uncharacterized protein n=1 Tax=Nepenthes gracilis TaxID=150966 RepID=A0AAD3XEM6_NEPGR|nr:hypothetical protein Nepgr_003910 [Nepenthes gracilis]